MWIFWRNIILTLASHLLSYCGAQVLSDGTLLMKEVRENIEELTCQVYHYQLLFS